MKFSPPSQLRHGDARDGRVAAEYNIWCGLRKRCTNPHERGYKNYGGRGITFCARWAVYENFLADMGRRPSPQHTLDRIENNKGYGPDNCRWAVGTTQHRNKRSNHLLTVGGVTKTIMDWAEECGLGWSTIKERLRRGWSSERAVLTPAGTYRRH